MGPLVMAALRVMPQRAVRQLWAAEQSLRHFALSTVPPVDGEFPEAEYLLLEDFVRYDHVRGSRNSTVGATTCPWLTRARPLSFARNGRTRNRLVVITGAGVRCCRASFEDVPAPPL